MEDDNSNSTCLPDRASLAGASTVFLYTGGNDDPIPNDIKRVKITSDVETIAPSAFQNFEWLEEIDFSEASHLKTIGDKAFFNCQRLCGTVDFSAALKLQRIGEMAFRQCHSLLEVCFGSAPVKAIGKGAFQGCEILTDVDLTQTLLTEVSTQAFRSCKCLRQVKLPTTIQVIHSGAFRFCDSLKHVELNEQLYRIENHAFHCCKLLETVDMSNARSLAFIGSLSFANCEALKSFHLPNNVETICMGAFSGCILLSDLHLNDGLQKIEVNAFNKCKSLRHVTMPSSVKHLHRAFKPLLLDSIDIRGPPNLGLMLRLFTLYPKIASKFNNMDRLIYDYSFQRTQSSDLLKPKPGLWTFLASSHGEKCESVRLKEIQRAYPDAVWRLVQWSANRGVFSNRSAIADTSWK
eukprot:scaffold9345_cov120-Cylindrotheca_fusiformis.AAC.4